MSAASICYFALSGIPLIEPGDDLAGILTTALRHSNVGLHDGDVLVVAQKIVSKAEGRYVDLRSITPSDRAVEIARQSGKEPRHVEVMLAESEDIVKVGPNVVIAAHRLGFVMANAGIDESNIRHDTAADRVLLLPCNPDDSAATLKQKLDQTFGVSIGVLINDSFGRPWRNGIVGVALGAAGVPSLIDRVGTPDLFGRKMKATEIAVADELAAAASLLMGQAAEGVPAVVVRGFHLDAPERPAKSLIRRRETDLFR